MRPALAAVVMLAAGLWSYSLPAWALDHAVLFVGNSYTSANQLDVMYGQLIAEAKPGWSDVSLARYTPGGYRLSQHAADATNGSQLDEYLHGGDPNHDWDMVVLQDQSQIPSFPPNNSEYVASRDGAVTLAQDITTIGAQTRLFVTWGRRDGDSMNMLQNPTFVAMQQNLDAGYEGYRQAIAQAGFSAELVPVGTAWKHIYDGVENGGQQPTAGDTLFTRLYSSDGSHPSAHGTYLTACTMLAALTDTSPVGLSWAPQGVPDLDRDALQAAAWQAVSGDTGAGGSGGATAAGGGGASAAGGAAATGGHGGEPTGSGAEDPSAMPTAGPPTPACSCRLVGPNSGHGWWLVTLLGVVLHRRRASR